MSFMPAEVIKKKRRGEAHSAEELQELIRRYTEGEVPDYQMSAWLMAVCFQGMTAKETADLTLAMMNSGRTLKFSGLNFRATDKHSTGGVGDKTSIIIAPLVAAAGVPVPMMAGRGLGHTGGTLDKLESISGFNVRLGLDAFQKQVADFGTAIIGQTKDICPADLKLYSLRDVTGTVDSIPLICASIMSKKLAEGVESLVLDVKYGSGAFMKSVTAASELAQGLVAIGEERKVKVIALVTNMNQPLGRYAGNACEVQECIDIMTGHVDHRMYADTIELTLRLSAEMLVLAGAEKDLKSAEARCRQLLKDGSAYKKFLELCKIQGASADFQLPKPRAEHMVVAHGPGYMFDLNCEQVGLAGIELGAGRRLTTDPIDHSAGIEFMAKVGDRVESKQPLFRLFAKDDRGFAAAEQRLRAALKISSSPPAGERLIAARVTSQGVQNA